MGRVLSAEGLSRRTLAVGLIVGVPVSAVFLYLATRDLDLGAVWTTLGRADLAEVAAALLAIAVLYLLQAQRWRVIAGREADVGRRGFIEMVVGSVAVNNICPGRPGDIMRGYWLSRTARTPLMRALATVVVDRSADVVVLTAMIVATLPLVDHPRWLTRLVLGALVVAALAAAALALGRWRALRRGAGPSSTRSGARRQLSLLVRGIGKVASPARLGPAALLTLGSWVMFGIAAWWIAQSLGIALSVPESAFVTAAVNLGVAIPSSPGFVGTYQWLSVAALGLFGVPRADAFAFSLLMQAVWWVPTTLAGVALAARALSRAPARLARVATEDRDAA
jgi:uncharacterized membrane protein YbhN (UPF0104 family)